MYNARNYFKAACKDVLIIILRRLWLTRLIFEIYSKITLFFGHLFLHGYYGGIVSKGNLIAFLEVLDQARRTKKLTHQPKERVNQKNDIYEKETK